MSKKSPNLVTLASTYLPTHTISNIVMAEMDDKGIKYGNEYA